MSNTSTPTSTAEVARDLFKRLRAEDNGRGHGKIVDQYIAENTQHPNLPIFLTSASETEKKSLCIMLRKALDADDFSAFGEAPDGGGGDNGGEASGDSGAEDGESGKDKSDKSAKPDNSGGSAKKTARKKSAAKTRPSSGGDGEDPLVARIRAICREEVEQSGPAAAQVSKEYIESVASGILNGDELRKTIREEIVSYFQSIVGKQQTNE